MFGWAGQILRVDLSTGGSSIEPVAEEDRRWYNGCVRY